MAFVERLLSKRLEIAADFAVIGLSTLVLIGSYFDITSLTAILPQFISMKVNTAFGFIFLSLSTVFSREESSSRFSLQVSSVFSRLALLVGCFTLAEYLFGVNFWMNDFF